MLFKFLKYLQPTHYFQLYRKDGTSIFPIVSGLPKDILEQIPPDRSYDSSYAAEYDISWQALQKGYIGNTGTYTSFRKTPLIDEYRFCRKYFNPVWVFYVLFLRMISLRNPLKEIGAWWGSREVMRSDYLENPVSHNGWENYHSSLIEKRPLVSIVIPTLNRYQYLKDVLKDLEKQDYKNFEVIVVDQSEPFIEKFYENLKIDVWLIRQTEKALWLARNKAVKAAAGQYILLFDDDSRVSPTWISNHLKCLEFFEADISSGVSISKIGAAVPTNYSFFRISDQIDTGNVLLKKEIFKNVGLFDRQFEKQRMGDAEFGLRCFLSGFKNVSNPKAGRLHLKVGKGGLREMGSWDAFRPKNHLGPRPIPSVLYFYRNYFGRKRSLLALMRSVPPSIIPYRYKKKKKMLVFGVFISILLFPLVLLQVLISWRLATKKLEQGARIHELK